MHAISLQIVYFAAVALIQALILCLGLMLARRFVSVHRSGHITLRTDKNVVARELIVALGVLGEAQELGADDERLSELAAHVRMVESEFRILSGQLAS